MVTGRCSQLLWTISTFVIYIDSILSLELLELRVPMHVALGTRAALLCRWALGPSDVLYSVKWYKDGNEFFRHVPRDHEPRRKFPLPGVDVEQSDASGSSLVLSAAVSGTGGRYRCEVSGERPLFPTASGHADLEVVVLPDHGPVLSGLRSRYHLGDRVQVNCTSGRSRPSTHLTWYINGEPAPTTAVLPSIHQTYEDLETTTLLLDFVLTDQHFNSNGLKVKCLATLSSLYWRSNEESALLEKGKVYDMLTPYAPETTTKADSIPTSLATLLTSSSTSIVIMLLAAFCTRYNLLMKKWGIKKMAPICRSENEVCKVENICKQSCYDMKEPSISLGSFHNKKADENELSIALIKSAKRSGQLNLSNRGLGSVPENVWKIDELVLEETKEVDFTRNDSNRWWIAEPLKTLDLSSNAIKVISGNVKFLQHLVNLKLHDNAISSLPPEFGELKSLMNLSLSHNRLTTVPKEFYRLTELRWLNMSHNELSKIEPDFGDFVMLNFLDLSHNKLKILPPGMGYLVRLVEINLSHNELKELPPDIVNLRDLKKMNISNNNLKKLPPLGELRKMEVLDANHNNIGELPDFYGCSALKELYIANNYIKEITDEFCDQMQHLSILNIRDNQVEVLPENISLLQNLKRLELTNNNLNKLPRNLGLLSQLQSINMEGNKLSFVRQDVIRGGTERMMKYLRDRITEEVVSETRFTLDEWPDKYTLKKSQALMMPGRDLAKVPDHVFATAAEVDVHTVDISKNKLTVIPEGIVHLSDSLTSLVLSSNILKCVPPEISRCKNLQYMDLGKNLLMDLPPELGDLKHLRELVISNNKLTKIPRSVYDLENLEILLAAENKIDEINVSSDALAKMKKLAVLDLTNNSILTVPPELGHFTHLRSLELMGNLFRQPRHAILAKGTASILSYLRDRIPTN